MDKKTKVGLKQFGMAVAVTATGVIVAGLVTGSMNLSILWNRVKSLIPSKAV